jgi:hypothetical protein
MVSLPSAFLISIFLGTTDSLIDGAASCEASETNSNCVRINLIIIYFFG